MKCFYAVFLNLDNAQQYFFIFCIIIGEPVDCVNGGATHAFWIKILTTQNGINGWILSSAGWSPKTAGVQITYKNDNTIRIRIARVGGVGDLNFVNAVTDSPLNEYLGEWFHMVVVWFSAEPNVDLYYNSVAQSLSGDTTWSSPNNYACQAWAGEMGFREKWTNQNPDPADMLIDEVKFYDFPMSAYQVRAMYNEYAIYGTGP